MKLRFWKRSAPDEVKITDISLPNQPINVYSTDQAMCLSAAYRCTVILSGTIASLPLNIKRNRRGVFMVDKRDVLHKLLTRRPNNRMTSFEMIRSTVVQMLSQGNAYIIPEFSFGEYSRLVLLSPGTVTYDKYSNVYVVNDHINMIYGTYLSDRIVHLKNNSMDGGYTGVSVITYASRVFSIAASADNQSLKTFQNGSKIKGIISGTKGVQRGVSSLTDVQTEDVAARVESDFNSGRDIVSVNEEMKFDQLSITPADAQLLETKKFSVLDICRFYGVHPDKAFAGQSTNYKASEMSNVSFLADTLQPLLVQIEAEFNAKLIPDLVADDYKIEFDRNALYQTDLTTQASFWKTLLEIGGITSNEIRAKQGLEAKEGGDTLFISCNVAPADSAKIRGEEKSSRSELPKTE